MDTAKCLLRRAGGIGFDKYLFLMQLQETAMVDLTPFHRSLLGAWKVFFSFQDHVIYPLGIGYQRSHCSSRLLTSENVRMWLLVAGCRKLGHILQK